MAQHGNAPAGEEKGSVTKVSAEVRVRELARREDWRERVAALNLSEREARALRVAVVRQRCFGGQG